MALWCVLKVSVLRVWRAENTGIEPTKGQYQSSGDDLT